MGALDLSGLPEGALLLIDNAPIVYWLEQRPVLAERFWPLFELHAAGGVQFAVATVTITDVLTGPLKKGDDALASRYRAVMESWRVVDLTSGIAEDAARLRARLNLKLADAVQAASALAINADAPVTHDRDFTRVSALRVIA
ncbi:MAG: type II toxin-antitoxin system VapC family toxin [Vitreimonas sp.]